MYKYIQKYPADLDLQDDFYAGSDSPERERSTVPTVYITTLARCIARFIFAFLEFAIREIAPMPSAAVAADISNTFFAIITSESCRYENYDRKTALLFKKLKVWTFRAIILRNQTRSRT